MVKHTGRPWDILHLFCHSQYLSLVKISSDNANPALVYYNTYLEVELGGSNSKMLILLSPKCLKHEQRRVLLGTIFLLKIFFSQLSSQIFGPALLEARSRNGSHAAPFPFCISLYYLYPGFPAETGGSRSRPNVCKILPNYAVSHYRRQ
jgi:hypothetical protein